MNDELKFELTVALRNLRELFVKRHYLEAESVSWALGRHMTSALLTAGGEANPNFAREIADTLLRARVHLESKECVTQPDDYTALERAEELLDEYEAACRLLYSELGFDPQGTVTGRLSSSRPNLQNIPRKA